MICFNDHDRANRAWLLARSRNYPYAARTDFTVKPMAVDREMKVSMCSAPVGEHRIWRFQTAEARDAFCTLFEGEVV